MSCTVFPTHIPSLAAHPSRGKGGHMCAWVGSRQSSVCFPDHWNREHMQSCILGERSTAGPACRFALHALALQCTANLLRGCQIRLLCQQRSCPLSTPLPSLPSWGKAVVEIGANEILTRSLMALVARPGPCWSLTLHQSCRRFPGLLGSCSANQTLITLHGQVQFVGGVVASVGGRRAWGCKLATPR